MVRSLGGHRIIATLSLGLAFAWAPAVPAVAAPQAGEPGASRIRPELRARIAAHPDRAHDTIVVLRRGSDAAAVRQVAAGVHRQLDEADAFSIIPGFRARLRPAQIEELARDPRVAVVSENGRVRATLQTARRWFGVDAAYDRGYTGGDGVTGGSATDAVVAVADTGIDAETPELAGRVIAFVDCTGSTATARECVTAPASDLNGHGTHVAGIAAGAGNDPALRGVAPGAALVGIRILGADGSGTFDSVIAGIEWAAAHQGGAESIDVLNLSIGVPCATGCNDGHVLSMAVNAAAEGGLPVVVAAGNAGPGRGTVEVPGAASGAITVGAMSDLRPGDGEPGASNHGYRIASFSSRGPTSDGRVKPDLVAPGVSIRAACSHDAPPPSSTRDGCPDASTHSAVISGTSMSAPFVSGTVALLRAVAPTLSPADVRAVLTGTAVPWGSDDAPMVPGHQSNDYGAGRLDVAAAVAAAANPDPVAPAVPAHGHAAGSVSGTGTTACFQFDASSAYPLVATVLEPAGGTTNNLRVRLESPGGETLAVSPSPVGSSSIAHREDVAAFEPASGPYRAVVEVVSGSSTFDLDVSNAESFGPCAPRVLGFSASDAGPTPGAAAPGFTNGDVRVAFTPDAANVGASWMVTTTPDPPAPGASGWTPLSLTTLDISGQVEGSLTLYPWLRSTLGAVSSSADAAARAVSVTLDRTPPTTPGTAALDDAAGYLRAREQASVSWTPVTDDHLGSLPITLELIDGGGPLGALGTSLGGPRPNSGEAVWTAPDDRELPEGRVRVVATDQAGNQASAVASGSLYLMRLGAYWADAFGAVHRYGDVPAVDESRRFGFRIARGLAMLPAVGGGYLLDGYGGVHRFPVGSGQAPAALADGPYWPGWDIARDLAIAPDGSGGYVLDGFGGIHPIGAAPDVEGAPYFGWDIARRIVLSPTGTGGYVLDGYGGIHVFTVKGASSTPANPRGPYFGFDIARALVVRAVPGGVAGYVLDGYGGLHSVAFGSAALPPGAGQGPYWNGWDITRGIQLLPDGSGGYVLDGYGGGHPWRAQGSALPPGLPGTGYQGADVARAFASR